MSYLRHHRQRIYFAKTKQFSNQFSLSIFSTNLALDPFWDRSHISNLAQLANLAIDPFWFIFDISNLARLASLALVSFGSFLLIFFIVSILRPSPLAVFLFSCDFRHLSFSSSSSSPHPSAYYYILFPVTSYPSSAGAFFIYHPSPQFL